ncbi:MAG TPA: sensor histidine kinase [Candidatus Acidoferrales bacterium]|nr:sensor histidine kinase [Candidatus Acidoferrales bacterium]
MNGLASQLEKRPRALCATYSVLLVAIIGVIDYLAGYAIFFSAFYLIPVAMAAWYVGRAFGIAISIACVTVSVVGDRAAGASYPNVLVPIWNGAIELTIYFVVVMILTSLRKLHRELEERVRQRTNALTNEMQERARLEKELLEVSEREQRRIGHDLHDGVCQHWAATAIAGQVLGEKLAAKSLPEAADAREVVKLVEDGITLTRNLAHGIAPPEMESEGLVTALRQYAANVSKMFRMQCLFECESPPLIDDTAAATHLYRITQEAVNNAIRHGKPRQIVISLGNRKNAVELTVEDDGEGLPDDWQKNRGLGTRIMAHRAAMIGGSFSIEPNPTGGTFVKCSVPAQPK